MWQARPADTATLILSLAAAWSCEPTLDVGAWKCAAAPLFIPPDGSDEIPGRDTTVTPFWRTSFEDGFCGYAEARGFCYSAPGATYRIVDAPARTGRKAAAFTITTDDSVEGEQTRCVREGALPKEAYYTASFYIPSGTKSEGNWNLMHFRTATATFPLKGSWDVSIVTSADGKLLPLLRDYVGGTISRPVEDHELPTDEWFTLSLWLRRESTETGAAALYLNGELIDERTDIVTDSSSTWGQWYVGNLADNLNPPTSTIYVDDVSIHETLDVSP